MSGRSAQHRVVTSMWQVMCLYFGNSDCTALLVASEEHVLEALP